MKVLVLVLITLFLSVPTYAKTYNHETSKEIVLKGKVLAFGIRVHGDLVMSVKYKNRLFSCRQDGYTAKVYCNEHVDGE